MQKVLHINPDKCTGCLQCEMACSFENYGTFATAKSRIKVFDFRVFQPLEAARSERLAADGLGDGLGRAACGRLRDRPR